MKQIALLNADLNEDNIEVVEKVIALVERFNIQHIEELYNIIGHEYKLFGEEE